MFSFEDIDTNMKKGKPKKQTAIYLKRITISETSITRYLTNNKKMKSFRDGSDCN